MINKLDDFVNEVVDVAKGLPSPLDGTVKIKYSPATDDGKALFVVESEGETHSIPAPKLSSFVDNPLTDPAARHKLVHIENNIKKTVHGQDDAVKIVSRAIRAKSLNTQKKTPASAVLLGPTGTGKTEIGKAVATEVFGDSRRMLRIDLGDVKNEGQFNNIFGSAKGHIGSDSPSAFERFLIDFPEGGVIMFDEVGNMGGNGTSKADLLKKFYPMLDEGEWRNAHGKVYDLSKYVILFSSNEGEEQFKGLPSDDLRKAAWESAKGKDAVAETLKQHGWPEALVARFQGNTVMMKPLMENEREYIAKKLFSTTFDQLAAQHQLRNYEVEPDFYKKAGTTFFSHTRGARAIRGVSEGALTDLIGNVLIDNFESKDLRHSTLHLSLTDNYSGLHSYDGAFPPKREVKLTATLQGPYETKVYEADVTDDAAMKRLHSHVELETTAIHEAGHAFANIPEKTGQALDFVTVRGEGNYGGYARYVDVLHKGTITRDDLIARIAQLMGGHEAEKLIGVPQNSGWSNDLEKAHELAKKAVTEWGLSRDPFKTKSDSSVAHEVESILEEGRKLAEKRLRDQWPAVRTLANKLKAQGQLNRHEIDVLMAETSTPEFRAKFAKEHPNDPVIHKDHGIKSSCVLDEITRDLTDEMMHLIH